jgi:hypothetical protein
LAANKVYMPKLVVSIDYNKLFKLKQIKWEAGEEAFQNFLTKKIKNRRKKKNENC